MKHLKKFNESISLDEIISVCKDILMDLEDDGINIKIDISMFGYSAIVLEIGDDIKKIRLGKYRSSFESLFSYLESNGIVYKNGYYQSDSWETYEICPRCKGVNISQSEYQGGDIILKCNKCGLEDEYSAFNIMEHPLDKGELFYYQLKNEQPTFMYFEFRR